MDNGWMIVLAAGLIVGGCCGTGGGQKAVDLGGRVPVCAATSTGTISATDLQAKMETLSFDVHFGYGCRMCYDLKTPEEKEKIQAESRKDWFSYFQKIGVTWPEGADIEADVDRQTIKVTNTAENLLKIVKHLREGYGQWRQIVIDARFVEADRTALDAVGLTGVKQIDNADMILDQLLKRDGVRLIEAFREISQSGEECRVINVSEYRFPDSYQVGINDSSSASNRVSASKGIPIAVPVSFETRQVGVTLTLTPGIQQDSNMIHLMVSAEVVGKPIWKEYGIKVSHPMEGSLDLPMEQPFFPIASCSGNVSLPIGKTALWVMGGLSAGNGEDGKMILLFLTPSVDRSEEQKMPILPK
ncbi:MAG: hypothetical protein J6334_05955 [Kiritimatiellae bacterium]|nr:hypothetical protein [Kiritimatiellia bacterium]